MKTATMEFWKVLCLFCSYNISLTVNCRGFPRQLTAADFFIPWQLTAEGQFRILNMFFNPIKCVNSNFQKDRQFPFSPYSIPKIYPFELYDSNFFLKIFYYTIQNQLKTRKQFMIDMNVSTDHCIMHIKTAQQF